MAAASGRFIEFVVVRNVVAAAAPACGASPPPEVRGRADDCEDWSDVEALLASSAPIAAASKRARSHALPLLASSAVVSVAFAGLIATAFYRAAPPAGCGSRPEGCVSEAAVSAPAEQIPVETLAPPAPKTPDPTTAQAAADASQPVVQGRSVGEERGDVQTEAAPGHGRRHHHRNRW